MNKLARRLANWLVRVLTMPMTVIVLLLWVALWAGPITPPDEFAVQTVVDDPSEPAYSAEAQLDTAPNSPHWTLLLRGEPNDFVAQASRFSRPLSARGRMAFELGNGG